MRRPLVVTIEHNSTKDEVRARLGQNLDRIRADVAPYVSTLDSEWQGDTVAFRAGALGQTVRGDIAVEERVVRVTVFLPPLLAFLGNRIAPLIRDAGLKLLAPK